MSVEEASVTDHAATNECGVDSTGIEQARPGSLAHAVLQRLRALSPDKQQQVLEFAEFLAHKQVPKRPRRSVKGLWADLNVRITEEDIAEARREMWGNFPRDDI